MFNKSLLNLDLRNEDLCSGVRALKVSKRRKITAFLDAVTAMSGSLLTGAGSRPPLQRRSPPCPRATPCPGCINRASQEK